MKVIITEDQYSVIRKKGLLGRGAMHKVYPSEINPDMVYKIGEKEIVDMWYDIFRRYPNIFPRVYKRGVTRVKEFGKEMEVSYVMLERLDTERSKREWGDINRYIVENNLAISFGGLMVDYKNSIEDIVKIYEYMEENGEDWLSEVYKRFVVLIGKVVDVYGDADIHDDQFGYDSRGRLKCLDL